MSDPSDAAGHGRHRRAEDAGTNFGEEELLPAEAPDERPPLSQPPRLPQPEPGTRGRAGRSPWNRPRDRLIAAAIVLVVVIAGVAVWATSDIRATDAQTAAEPQAVPAGPAQLPGTLTERWRANSPATPEPVAEDTGVVTGSGNEVTGHDPLTGQVRWHYRRDLELCTIGKQWARAVVLYRKGDFCSEVTQLDPGTGARTAQRNGDARPGTRLVGDGAHLTATGTKLLNTWRDDLVKTMEYGEVPAIINPGKQPRVGCTYGTVAAAAGRIGVIERCPDERSARFTVYKATGDDFDQPKQVFSAVLAGSSARLVAMAGDSAAVELPERKLLVIYGGDGNQRAAYPLDLPAADLANEPAGGVMPTTITPSGIYWFTGSRTMALSHDDLTPQWTLNGSLGSGTTFGSQYVVPIRGGLAVLNQENGSTIRTVGVDRGGYQGPVELSSVGPMLLEQRGGTLVALR